MKKSIILATTMLIAFAASLTAQTAGTFLDNSLSFRDRARDLVSRLTLQEKIAQMGNMVDTQVNRTDADGLHIVLPAYQYWNEALHGVARSGAATSFPASKAMSATWDRQLVRNCATAISDEARVYNNLYGKNLNYWCPTINMSRDPRWGRDEENYGEDPFLCGTLAVQFIKGMQGEQTADNPYFKTIACAKHFAANNYEQGRQGSTSFMTEHILREYYLPAFEMAVRDGGVQSIMSSYNALSTDINEKNAAGVGFGDAAAKGKAWGGKPNAMNDWLLTGILRQEWGFNGYVTSDCAGVSCIYRSVKHFYYGNMFGTYTDDAGEINTLYQAHATADAIRSGNDMNCEFKNRTSVFQSALDAAISLGLMTEADLDEALVRVLTTRFALGEFDDVNPWASLGLETLESEANQALALQAAHESIVLLKNENISGNEPLLPISTDKTVALIGPYANAIMLGDYSGTPTHTTTPFQAFSDKLDFHVSDGTIQAEAFDEVLSGDASKMNQGKGYLENTAPGNVVLYRNIDFGNGCTNFIMAAAAKSNGVATVNFYLDSDSGTPFLSIDNKDTGSWTRWEEITANVDPSAVKGVHNLYVKFTGSNRYAGNYDYFRFYNPDSNPLEELGPLYMVQTSNAVNEVTTADMIARAVAVAQKADVVIFFGGTDFSKPADHATGTESHDRFKITLPGNQEQVLKALYEVNPNVVLVLESNSSMDITWAKENLPAILEAWYGGQAQGQAICDVIYGDYNPSGKLTSTWYNSLAELPAASDSQFKADGMLEYNIDQWGYTYMYYGKGTGDNVARQAATPMYPFGYGLSYSTFSYSNCSVSSTSLPKDGTVYVTVTVTNNSDRDGAEVMQVYASFPNSAVTHIRNMNRRLVGFERVEVPAHESRTVTIPVRHDQLCYFNEATHTYDVEGEAVTLYVSASSADDRWSTTVTPTAATVKTTFYYDTQQVQAPSAANQQPSVTIYNLQGQRVRTMQAGNIYVVGGRKVTRPTS